MNAPNPTQKRKLKLTKRTHSQQTQNNIPGSVPIITPTAPKLLIANLPPPSIMIPRRSPQTSSKTVVPKPMHIPPVHFIPVDSGLRNKKKLSQEAINFLPKRIWPIRQTSALQQSSKLNLPHHVWILHKLQCRWYIQPPAKQLIATNPVCKTLQQRRCGKRHLAEILVVWHKATIRRDKKALILFLS